MRLRINPQAGWAYLIPGDIHFPMHDPAAVAAMQHYWDDNFWAMRRGVICQGDTIDPYGISRFPKKSKKMLDFGRITTAVDAARPFLEWAADQPLGCEFLLGNHEGWIAEFFEQHLALEGLPGLEFGALTGLDDIDDLHVYPEKTKIVLSDKVVVCHGHDLGAKTAKTVMARYPNQYTVYGHYHSIYTDSRTVYGADGEPSYRGCACVGMLADPLQFDYADDPDMQLGFATLEFFGDRGNGKPFFKVTPHYIVKDSHGNAWVA